jgi:hypothetical protein
VALEPVDKVQERSCFNEPRRDDQDFSEEKRVPITLRHLGQEALRLCKALFYNPY